jgi:hypothetical protein
MTAEGHEEFLGFIAQVAGDIEGRPHDAALKERFNAHVPPKQVCVGQPRNACLAPITTRP